MHRLLASCDGEWLSNDWMNAFSCVLRIGFDMADMYLMQLTVLKHEHAHSDAMAGGADVMS